MSTANNLSAILQDFLTVAQSAKQLGITPRAVQTACQRGHLPGAIQLGRDWRIPPAAIAARKKAFGVGPIPQKQRPNRTPAKDLQPTKKSRRK